MKIENPTAHPCTHLFSHPPSNFQSTATPSSTPVNYSRPFDPSTSTNNSQQPKTREEKGKDKEATENNEEEGQGDISAEIKTPEPQLQSRKGDDDDGDEDEEEEEDEYIEVFQVLANIARMKVFGERMNNAEGGALSGGLGKAGWYYEVQYFGMRGFSEHIAGDGISDNGGSFNEGESEGHGNGGREEGEEKEEEEEKERKEEEEGEEIEDDDDEENYVIVTFLPLGEQTESDDESWYFVGNSDEEEDSDDDEGSKDNKDTENNEDKKGNVNRSESNNTNNNSKKGNKNDDLDSNNYEWHDLHHHCHHCQSFHSIIITQTTTTTNPQRQPHPQLQEQGRIPLVNPSFEILQSSPTSFTIQLAIPGAKRRDISVAYDLNTNVLTLSGVLYRSVLSLDDSPSTSSSTSSSLESESETDSKGRPNAEMNQGSPHKLKPEFDADLELWLAYERASRPAGVFSGSGSVLLFGGYGEEEEEEEEEEGKQAGGGGGGDGGGDGVSSSTDTDDSDNKQSQTQTQTQTQTPPPTATEIIPIGQILDQVNFVIFCSPTPTTSECRLSPSITPEEQEQHKEVNLEQIKARLEDGMPTVVVPLAVEEEVENESMVGIAL